MDERTYDDVTRPGHYCHGGYECAAVVEAVDRKSVV